MKLIQIDEADFDEKVSFSIASILAPGATLGLTGGSSVRGIYEQLNAEGVRFILTDERFVASDSEDSNLGMVRATMGDENLLSFAVDDLSWERAADQMDRALNEILAECDYLFDLLLLGVGPDGHIASIFPESPALDSDKLAMTTITQEFAVEQRLTLTLKALSKSKEVWLLLKGERKRPVLELIQAGGDLPVHRLLEQVENVKVWFGS